MAALTFPYCRPGFIHLDSTPLRGAYLVGGGGGGVRRPMEIFYGLFPSCLKHEAWQDDACFRLLAPAY